MPLEKDNSFCKDDKKVEKRALTIVKIKKISLLETEIIILTEIEQLFENLQKKTSEWKKVKSNEQVEEQLFEEINKILEQKERK